MNWRLKLPSQKLVDIFYSVLKGLLPPVIAFICGIFYRKFCNINRWQIKKIFGEDADPKSKFYLIYAKLASNQNYDKFIFKKSPPISSSPSNYTFSADFVVSECEMRAVNYLNSVFANCDLCRPKLSNHDLNDYDISYISFGGFSNEMSIRVMNDNNNIFIELSKDGNNIVNKNN